MRVGGEHMPGWSETFSDTEMEALIQYVIKVAGHAKRSGDGKRAAVLTPIDNGAEPPKDRIAYGRALFKQICAGCHTLADAGATGKRYDLDYNYAGISVRERRMRAHAGLRGGPPFMPNWERSLTREQVDVLTDYVFEVTGRRSS
jgi:mono/diheme cytochrome c family protein